MWEALGSTLQHRNVTTTTKKEERKFTIKESAETKN
jgi:hypothetical protein